MIETSVVKTLAEFYVKSANDLDSISQDDRILFRRVIQKQFSEISKIVYFDFTTDDPYSYTSIDEVLADYEQGFIKVNTSGNNSILWGPVYNLMFRAIHDYIHCKYKLGFTFDDEVMAYDKQMKLKHTPSKQLFAHALRSEIVYQAAYKEYYKEFHLPEQKIVLRSNF